METWNHYENVIPFIFLKGIYWSLCKEIEFEMETLDPYKNENGKSFDDLILYMWKKKPSKNTIKKIGYNLNKWKWFILGYLYFISYVFACVLLCCFTITKLEYHKMTCVLVWGVAKEVDLPWCLACG